MEGLSLAFLLWLGGTGSPSWGVLLKLFPTAVKTKALQILESHVPPPCEGVLGGEGLFVSGGRGQRAGPFAGAQITPLRPKSSHCVPLCTPYGAGHVSGATLPPPQAPQEDRAGIPLLAAPACPGSLPALQGVWGG